jgi:cytochrome c
MLLKSNRAPLAVLLCALACTLPGTAAAQGAEDAASLAKGKRLYMRCAACHDVSDTGPARIGPHLKGLVGRPAGAVAGYGYSADMKSKTFVWDEAALDAWLTKPTSLVPATSMAFVGMADAGERKALIAFLRSLK